MTIEGSDANPLTNLSLAQIYLEQAVIYNFLNKNVFGINLLLNSFKLFFQLGTGFKVFDSAATPKTQF
jgi:hypothetical protein